MNKIINTFIAMMIFFSEITQAQVTFQKTFNGCSLGAAVEQTSDGGYIMTGNTDGSRHVSLRKTDMNGNTIWNKTYGYDYYYGNSVQQTSDGGYIVAGYGESFSGYHRVYLVKTNANGDTSWTKTFGQNTSYDYDGNSVRQTTDGGYIIAGSTNKNGNEEVYLIKTNAMGNIVWTKTYGISNYSVGYCVRQTIDGGYIIGGSKGVGGDVFLIKTNSNGDTSWTKTYTGYGLFIDGGNIVQQTSDGGYIIASDKLGVNIYTTLIKTNSNGDTLWTKTYQNGGNTRGVQQTADDGYIVIGSTYYGVPGGYSDIYVIKTNPNGDTLWTNYFGTINYEYGNSIQQTSDGGFILTGNVCSSPDYLTYLIKTDYNGNVLSNITQNLIVTQNLVKIFPNPFNFYTNIQIDNLQSTIYNLQFTFYDMMGREILSKKLETQKTKLERDNLPEGIYFYKINNDKQEIMDSGKMIIQ